MSIDTPARGRRGRLVFSVVGCHIVGLVLAIFLAVGVFAGGTEGVVTGSVLIGFAVGWALMALTSTRFTDQPQRWAYVPAAALGLVGLALVVTQPTTQVIGVLSWIWPVALVALVVYMVIRARAALHSRLRRWVLYPIFAVLVLIAVGGGVEAAMEAVDRGAHPMTGQLVDVGDHSLRIECSGTGSPTVLLQSGLGESSFYWARIRAAVAKTAKVCSYDRAGRGWSEAAPAPQDGLAIAKDLHALLAASGNSGPYVLVGHSSGGVYVRIFADTYPDEVAGIVLLDSQPVDPFMDLSWYPAFYDGTPVLYGILPPVARLGVLRLLYASAFTDLPATARGEERADQSTPRLQASAREEIAQLRKSLQQGKAAKSLGDLPLAVVTAISEAEAGWLAAQDTLVALSTNSSHRVFPDLTHVGLITSEAGAAASSDAILDVLSAIRTRSALAD